MLLRAHFPLSLILASALLLAGCNHKTVAKASPAAAPPAPSPTASIQVAPQSVLKNESATISWTTSNASDVQIEGIGAVSASGSKQITPTESTTYHLVAKGQGGSAEANARLTVNAAPVAAVTTPSEEELFAQQMKDLFFDYDRYELRPTDQSTLSADADFLKQHSDLHFVIEGHCDERGSEEYNMALGDNRAETAKKQLVSMGVDATRIKIISYGKEKPFCNADDESCYQQNRRAHFAIDR